MLWPPPLVDYRLGQVLAEYAVRVLQLKKVVVVDDQTAYGKASASEFEKALKSAGGAVLRRGSVSSQSPDFSSILLDIRSQSPDAVFFDGDEVQAGNLVRQLAQTGSKAKVIGGSRSVCRKAVEAGSVAASAASSAACGTSSVCAASAPAATR